MRSAALPVRRNKISSSAQNLQVEDFPVLTVDGDFHRAATDFAVDGELLLGLRGVHRQREGLSTIWTLNIFRFLHLPSRRKTVTVPP
jgi:hypothetical protein